MNKVLFLCHGNICRSVMAQCILQDMVYKAGLQDEFLIDSAATSTEEIGNSIYPPAKKVLTAHDIPCLKHAARQITKQDYENFDFILCMEEYNLRNLRRMIPSDPDKKCYKLLDYVGIGGEIDDPWYTGQFEAVYSQLHAACGKLLKMLT